MSERAKLLIASGLGLGLAPVAPGTVAALLGVALHVAARGWLPEPWSTVVLVALLVLVSVANHVLTPWAQARWRSKDPRHFVLDEVAGYLVVPILFPYGRLWQVALWGFLVERAFDIVKIPPARGIDRRMGNAWGILLDDLIAGVYAAGALYAAAWVGPRLGWSGWLIAWSEAPPR